LPVILLSNGAGKAITVFPNRALKLIETVDTIMNKKWTTIIGSGVLVVGLAVAGASFANSDEAEVRGGTIRLENQAEADFPTLAQITNDLAVQKALAAVRGQVLKTELEDENGFLVYGVEVVTADKTIVDVKVDAGSGKILAMDRGHTRLEGRLGALLAEQGPVNVTACAWKPSGTGDEIQVNREHGRMHWKDNVLLLWDRLE
jgi:uncharacterized membrane protein YkoI